MHPSSPTPSAPLTREAGSHPASIVAPFGSLDLLGIALLATVILFLSFLQSRHLMFWSDEVMGDLVLNAGSWHAFLGRWRAGIDSSGIWFYILAKPWELVFGASELSLRMFSGFGVAVAASIIWVVGRRFYSITVVAASVTLLFLDVGVLRWQLSNARCYGVLMASVALLIYLLVRGEEEATRKPSFPFLLATFFAYDLAAGSHILGMLYAGAIFGIQLYLDFRARRFRPGLYLAAFLGIASVVLFSLANLRSTTALGKPVFWTHRPSLADFFLRTDLLNSPALYALAVLVLLTLLHARRRPARDLVYVVLLGFVLLDGIFFTVSRVSTSIYVDRYLLPFTLGLVLLCAECLTQLQADTMVPSWLRRAAPFMLLLYAAYKAPAPRSWFLPLPNYTDALLATLPPALPIVDADPGTFVEVEHYHHGRFGRPFICPDDVDLAYDPENPAVGAFHEMVNFSQQGIDAPDLQPTKVIFETYPTFLVLADDGPGTWFRKRVRSNPQFEERELGILHAGMTTTHVWEVHRLSLDARHAS